MTDYYAVLGVRRDATPGEINKAYRRLARELHPDVAGPSAVGRFESVSQAYAVLGDPQMRRAYDLSGGGTGPVADAAPVYGTPPDRSCPAPSDVTDAGFGHDVAEVCTHDLVLTFDGRVLEIFGSFWYRGQTRPPSLRFHAGRSVLEIDDPDRRGQRTLKLFESPADVSCTVSATIRADDWDRVAPFLARVAAAFDRQV